MRSGCRLALALALSAAFLACSPPPADGTPDAGTTETSDGGGTQPTDDGGTVLPGDGGSPQTDGGTKTDGGTANGCGFDKFGQQLGWACNRDADCKSGSCLLGLAATGACTQACDDASNPCPTGYSCLPFGAAGENVCAADNPDLPAPGDHSLKPGAPCAKNDDCAGEGAVCAAMDNGDGTYFTFCAPACESDSACGACGTCTSFGNSGSFCEPKGPGAIGQKCASPLDCQSFICAGFCTDVCAGQGQTKACPAGSSCEPLSDAVSICITPAQKGATAPGGSCTFDFECKGGNKCLADQLTGLPVCTVPKAQGEACEVTAECAGGLHCVPDTTGTGSTCQPPRAIGGTCAESADCTTGLDCRDLSGSLAVCTKGCGGGCGSGNSCVAPDLDTDLRLFNSMASSIYDYVAHNDDIDTASGNQWSQLTQTLQPGTYWVMVQTYKNFIADYQLELLTGQGTPTPAVELENPTRNDKQADATIIGALPATVAATIDSANDVDWYKFTLTQASTVTLRLSRGDPSVCLPNSLVGQQALGQACSFNLACQSSLCEGRLKICGQTCSQDSDCGDPAFKCGDFGSHKSCIPGALVGQKATDAKCDYSFECADGYCANFKYSKFCTSRCESAPCTAGKECASLKVTAATGAQTVEQACVPQGSKTATFGQTCQLQSDCTSGVCGADGRCTTSCTGSSQCPDQNLAPTAGSVACQPCTYSSDCGTDGRCLTGVGLERFCVTACDPQGDKCDPGFHCEDNGFGTKLCKPDAGSCHVPFCDAQASRCVVAPSTIGELCSKANDCTTQTCGADGLCTKSCTQNSDCGCGTGDVVCKAGSCQMASYTGETEPNDTLAIAQALGAAPVTLFATTRPNGASPDTDYFTVQLTGGKKVSVVSRPVCGTAAPALDLAVTLLDAQGNEVATDDFLDNYGKITDQAVTTTGTYVIKVEDESYTTPKVAGYILEVTVQ